MSSQYAKQQPAGFVNRIERVAIVGVGGHVGSYIVEQLLKTGEHKVTALMRADSKSEVPQGVERKAIDYQSYSTLVEALQGQQALIITMSVRAPKQQQADLIKAAAEANVPWVMPNHWGADVTIPKLSEEMLHGTACKEATGLIEAEGKSSWIVPVSSFWYEFSLVAGPHCYGFDIEKRTVSLYNDGNTKINTSTWLQCGRAVAAVLSLKVLPEDESDKSLTLSSYRNSCLYISSFLVSQRDMLASLLRVTGTSEKDWQITENSLPEYYHKALEALKTGERAAFARAMYSRLFFKTNDGDYSPKVDNERLGLPKEDIDEATARGVQWTKDGKVDWYFA